MKKLFEEIPRIEGRNIIIRRLEKEDAAALGELMQDEVVYRYLPTFLLEKQYDDPIEVISLMYGKCIEEKSAIHLGVFAKDSGEFYGLAEMYGYKDELHKISLGYRLKSSCWGRHIASEAVGLVINYLYAETDIEIITASTMPENLASERVLQKNGFEMVVAFSDEDWGFEEMTPSDKWIR